jgi:predicted O-methyltransferase YrrM
LIASYIKYLLRAGNQHAIHSPFLFSFYNRVITRRHDEKSIYKDIDQLRKELLSSREEIEILDLGAGSRINKTNKRQIRQIAKNAEKPEKFGKLFSRIVTDLMPSTIFELGTSLGLTTAYFAKSVPNAQVVTFEGCPETARHARRNLDRLAVNNCEIVVGNIDATLQERLKGMETVDIVYFDANHRYEPTVRYFEQCLPYAGNDSLFIMDDIYWSDEMTQAWEYIKAHPSVTVTVDLFWIGLVFFRKEQVKENFVLRF